MKIAKLEIKNSKGFTLVEITLVVGILVVLSSIVLVALNIRGNNAAANNVKRKIDLESIQKALDLRAQETGDSLPENLPTKATCIGNGGSETFDLQSVNWAETAPSTDADIRFDVHSCNDENCNGDSWPGLNFSDPAAANSLAGVSDTTFFQYQAEFKDYKYPSGVAVEEKMIHPTCAGYTIGVDCYTSLATWEDGEDGSAGDRNLATENKIAVAKIIGDWTGYTDITTVPINNWITDETRYIRIYTAPEARHSGKWDNSKYKLVVSNNYGISISEDFVRIDGLQIQVSSSVADRGGIWMLSANNNAEILISNNLIKGNESDAVNKWGIIPAQQSSPNTRVVKIWNNVIYDFKNSGLQFGIDIRRGWIAYVYNNTIYNNITGIRRYDTDAPIVIARNNISYNNGTNYNGTFDGSSDFNLSGPTQTNAPGANSQNGVTVAFVDATNKDLHLQVFDINAKNKGVDLSADTNLAFNTDIERQVRPAESFWDIGADEAGALASDFTLKDVTIGLNINPAGSPQTFLDTVYNDFVKGTTSSSSLVVSGESNPNDANSGAITYAGGSGSPTYTSQVFSSLCYDLSNDLADYLGEIPKDPKTGTDENTGYLISVDPATKVVCVKAPGAENDEVIENCRK